ncbi:MAG: hypothetical protein K9G64_07540 [Bacteroidia bacterium]|nr:hypothetical protein [Bacteroidia bacterium]
MILKFYKAQKAHGLLFIFIGFIAIIIASILVIKVNNEFSNGITLPILIIGILQVYFGINTFKNTPIHLLLVQGFVKENQASIVNIEIPFIHKEILFQKKMINIFLFLIALAILFLFVFNNTLFLQGIGIGLFIQSLIVITANYFAEQRSQIYLKWLNDYYN